MRVAAGPFRRAPGPDALNGSIAEWRDDESTGGVGGVGQVMTPSAQGYQANEVEIGAALGPLDEVMDVERHAPATGLASVLG